MKRAAIPVGLLALALAATLLWFLRGGGDAPGGSDALPGRTLEGAASPTGPLLQPLAAELSGALLRPEGPPEDEIDAVAQLLYFYRQAFGENPVGDNADIVAALAGANAKEAAWIAPGIPAVVEGRLVDRWGTPYWFHANGAREMEVRSAGPDRELFTADDLATP